MYVNQPEKQSAGIKARTVDSPLVKRLIFWPWTLNIEDSPQGGNDMADRLKRMPPPYGPTEGMLQGLELMQRLSPARVDAVFLRSNKVAPGNEYKVIGALKFLGIITDDGKPTDKSRRLKIRGPSYQLAIQDIIRTAYKDMLAQVDLRYAKRDEIHNYFITEMGLGVEMATKATRFFISLCMQSEIPIGPNLLADIDKVSAVKQKSMPARNKRVTSKQTKSTPAKILAEKASLGLSPTVILAVTPETANMRPEELADIFRNIKAAFHQVFSEE